MDPVVPAQGVVQTIVRTPTQRYVRCTAELGADTKVVTWGVGLGVRTEA